MPANDVKFGITRHAGTLIDSVETDDSVQVKELPGSNGEIARVKPYRKMTEGSRERSRCAGCGAGCRRSGRERRLPKRGVTVITNVKQSENNEDFDGWEYSFKHYPTAEAVN